MSSESELRTELQSIEDMLRDTSRLFPFIVGVATIRRQQLSNDQDTLAPVTEVPPQTQAQQSVEGGEDDEGIVVINPITRRAIFFGFGRGGVDGVKTGPAPASKPAIESLPVEMVLEGDKGSECSICLEEMAVGEDAKWMPCKHRFHPGCIDKWLSMRGSCPVCRFLMPVDGVEGKKDGGGSDETTAVDPREWAMSVRLLVGTGRDNQGGSEEAVSDASQGLIGSDLLMSGLVNGLGPLGSVLGGSNVAGSGGGFAVMSAFGGDAEADGGGLAAVMSDSGDGSDQPRREAGGSLDGSGELGMEQ